MQLYTYLLFLSNSMCNDDITHCSGPVGPLHETDTLFTKLILCHYMGGLTNLMPPCVDEFLGVQLVFLKNWKTCQIKFLNFYNARSVDLHCISPSMSIITVIHTSAWKFGRRISFVKRPNSAQKRIDYTCLH